MSEFVECQNCGRRFFAENIDCPYCGREDADAEAPIVPIERARAGPGGLHGVLFGSFRLLLVGIAVFSVLTLPRASLAETRLFLGLEAAAAAATFVGLSRRRRWGRTLAILFIVANAALGLVALVLRGQGRTLAWGPGPMALLLFLVPFLGPQARDRFPR